MADTPETHEIDTDNMSMEEISSLKGKMIEGEDIAPASEQEPQPTPDPADPEVDAANAEAEADAAAAEPDQSGSKTVPHKTFHHERERRKEAEKREREAAERYARLEERTKLILEAQNGKPATAEQPKSDIPDDNDPMAILAWAKKEIVSRKEADAKQTEEQRQASEQQREWQQVYDRANQDYNAATEADPTVKEAHNAIRQSLADELTEVYGYTEQQAVAEIQRQENQHLAHIVQNGLDIGDYLKKLAKTRGWRPSEANPAPHTPQIPAPNTQKLEQARQSGASLGSSGGAVANSGKITPEMLADMPEEEFKAYMKQHGNTRGAFAA